MCQFKGYWDACKAHSANTYMYVIHVLKPAHIWRFPMNTQSGSVFGNLDLNNQSLGQRLHKIFRYLYTTEDTSLLRVSSVVHCLKKAETLCMTIVVKFWRLLRSFIYKYLLITMCVVHYIVSEYCAHKIFTANTVYSNLIKRACNAMSYLSTQHLVHLNYQVEQPGLPPKHQNPRYSVSEIVCYHGNMM